MLVFLLSVLVFITLLGLVAEKYLLPVWCWQLLLGLGLGLSLLAAGANIWWAVLIFLPFFLVALLFGMTSLRLRYLVVPWLERIQRALSQLKEEKASPPSWQRDLMMGRMPEIERTITLNGDEEKFLAKETVQLCQRWRRILAKDPKGEITSQLLAFISAQGFNRLRLSKAAGGRNFSRAAVASILTRLASCDERLAQLIMRLNGGLTLERYGTGSQKRKSLMKQSFIYSLSEQEVSGVYGVIAEGLYRNKEQPGIDLHWEDNLFYLPDFVSVIELVIPFYNTNGLLEANDQTHICLLLPSELLREWIKSRKPSGEKIFVPLNQIVAMKNEAVIPFIRSERSVYSLVLSYAGLLNLSYQASAGAASLRSLGEEVDLAALAGLSNELASLAELRELGLQLVHQGERITEQDLQGSINQIVARASMFGIGLSSSQPRLGSRLLTIAPARPSSMKLGSAVQLHEYWQEIRNNLTGEPEELDKLFMKIGAHCCRSLFRCFLYGIGSLISPSNLHRKQIHLVLAFGLVMDAVLIHRIGFRAYSSLSGKAWQAIYAVIAINQKAKEEWKDSISMAQEEIINLLAELPPVVRFLLKWTIFPLGKNYTRRTSAEDAILAEALMVPSQEREDRFRDLDSQGDANKQAEELLKLAWVVRTIYADLKEKNLHRPWELDELSWYRDLYDQKHISESDMNSMQDFYTRAKAFIG